MPMSVYVGGLTEDVQKKDLEHKFSKFGKVNKVWVAQNPPGFAFIEFEDDQAANEAIEKMNGAILSGCQLKVNFARNNSHQGGGRGRRGGGRGNYDSYQSGGYGGRGADGSRYWGGRPDYDFGGSSRASYGEGGGGGYGSNYRGRSPMGDGNGGSW